jgi:RNA polymerase sigma-70 factor, ECF subfamily
MTDGELCRLMGDGVEAAFLELYRRYQGPVYRFALHFCGSDATAEDVTQDVFLELMNGRVGYDASRGPLAPLLVGTARNLALRNLRRTKEHAVFEDDAAAVAAEFPTVVESLSRRQTVEAVRHAVASLPTHYREVVVLCELEEKSYQEAAAILECATGTVRSRLNRARAILMQKLAAQAEAPQPIGGIGATENAL